MRLPRGMARFNRVVTNRVQGVWAPYLPPWVMIVNRGRRSGRIYRTPVLASVRDGQLTVAALYGPDSDWVRNVVAAGSASVIRLGQTHTITQIRVLPSAAASGWTARLADHVVTARLD